MAQRSLVITLKVGQSINLDNGRIKLVLKEKSGQQAKLYLEMPDEIKVTDKTESAPVAPAFSGAEQARKGVKL